MIHLGFYGQLNEKSKFVAVLIVQQTCATNPGTLDNGKNI